MRGRELRGREHSLAGHYRGASPRVLLLAALVAIAALGFAALGGADLTPGTATFTLTPGVGQTESNKMLNLTSPKTDIELAIDTTGSMTDGLADAVAEANSIVSGVQSEYPDTNFAVVQFKDAGFNPEYQVVQPMTPTAGLIQSALGSLFASLGGDPPEAYNVVFHNAYSAQGPIGFRPGARQILLVIGDAQPHGMLNTVDGFTNCDDVGPDPDGYDTKTELTGVKNAGMTLLMIHVLDNFDSTRLSCYNDLVHWVNPNLDAVNSGGGDLATEIKALIEKANSYNQVALEVESVSPPPGDVSWVSLPTPITNISAGNSYQFGPIGFKAPVGTPPGTYTVVLDARADGSELLGQETVTLNVLPSAGLQICKAADNGANGVTFNYTAVNASTGASTPVKVTGGSCTMAPTLPKGKYTVKENLSSGLWTPTKIAVDPQSALVTAAGNPNLSAGTVKVSVTTTSLTKVTYTNTKVTTTLKVCKWSGAQSLQGKQYAFTVKNGATTIASPNVTAGKSATTAGCSAAIPVTAGAKLKITETVPAKQVVAGITATPSSILLSKNLKTGLANVTVAAGANQVTYEDEPTVGTFMVCKRSSILPNGAGPFWVDVSDTASPAHSYRFQLWVGTDDNQGGSTPTCNTVGVSGDVTVTEEPTPGYALQVPGGITVQGASIESGPTYPSADGTQGGSAVIPFDGTSNVEVDLHNLPAAQPTGQIELCKYIRAGDFVLKSALFSFTVQYADSSGNFQNALPAGVSPIIQLGPNRCTKPTNVTLGNDHTVRITETAIQPGYAFDPDDTTAYAAGDRSDLRIVGGVANPLTVSVPAGGGMTEIEFYNKVAQAQLKVCKTIDPGSLTTLGGLDYSFKVFVDGTLTATESVSPPYVPNASCTGILPISVLNSTTGNPTVVTVQEVAGGPYIVSSATVDNGTNSTTTGIPGAGGSITFNPGVGVDVVTFTNRAS